MLEADALAIAAVACAVLMAAPDTMAAAVDVILAVGGGIWRNPTNSWPGRPVVGSLASGFWGGKRNEDNPGGEVYILIGRHVAASF